MLGLRDKVTERIGVHNLQLLLGMDTNGGTPNKLAQHAGTQGQGK